MDEAFGLRSDRRIDRRSDLKSNPLPFAWDRRSTPSTAWFWVVVLSFWVSFSAFSAFSAPAMAAEPGRVVLNADRVSYDDETGRATAEGAAVLNYESKKFKFNYT